VSELRSAIEGFRSEALGELPDARAEEEFAELQRASELLEAERLRRLADLDRRGTYRADGHLSAVSWLVAGFGMGGGQAARDVSTARALESMPAVREAFEEGAVSSAKVRMLAEAQRAEPEAFSSSEGMLLQAARIHSVRDLGRVVGYWREAAEHERRNAYGFDDEDPLFNRRHLHASPTVFGLVKVDGLLDPENGGP
jgi:curved DNA-binding protein CbpA